jgi:hypothetical protein
MLRFFVERPFQRGQFVAFLYMDALERPSYLLGVCPSFDWKDDL